eukprot:scaffold100071_cov69-Phaeocystis_antarctica.AAC.8
MGSIRLIFVGAICGVACKALCPLEILFSKCKCRRGATPYLKPSIDLHAIELGWTRASGRHQLAASPRPLGIASLMEACHALRRVLPEAKERGQIVAEPQVAVNIEQYLAISELSETTQDDKGFPLPVPQAFGGIDYTVNLTPVGRQVVQGRGRA